MIGHPIGHSLSPALHDYWMHGLGMKGTYKAHDIQPENLPAALRELADAGYRGVNITLPHKETILPCLHRLDPSARGIGAVNTVIFHDARDWEGRNTDAAGFLKNLYHYQPHWQPSNSGVFILGAGGAARAALYALEQAGCEKILVANRTREKADRLKATFASVSVVDWPDQRAALRDISLLVNTTGLGMKGWPEPDIDLSALPRSAIVYDLVYNPLMTRLLDVAANRGNPVVSGLGMLAFQGAAAFEAWFGVRPPVDQPLLDHLKSCLGA